MSKPHAKLEDHDKGWAAMYRRVKKAGKGRVKVGVLSGEGAEDTEDDGITLGELAVIQHFGTDKIPSRPFLAMAFDKNREDLVNMGARFMAAVLFGDMTEERALGLMGAKLATEAKKVITIGNQLAPNALSTILRKAKKSKRVAGLLDANARGLAEAVRRGKRAIREKAISARVDARVNSLASKSKDLGSVFKNIGKAQQIREKASSDRERRAVRDHMSDIGRQFAQISAIAKASRPLVDTGRLLNSITWMISGEDSGHGH